MKAIITNMRSMLRHALWTFLLMALPSGLLAQALSGTKTIDNTGSGDYLSFTAAINDLNTNGVTGSGVTFNVVAGQTFSERPPAITATGTSSTPIVFQRSGSGVNPVVSPSAAGTITSTTFGANGDAVFQLAGSDYITFDGIDVQENSTHSTTTAKTEYGYYLTRASATDGCKNVTIKNCTITLDKAVTISAGIYISNNDASTGSAVTITATSGIHENITLDNDSISNAYHGIVARGYAASSPYDFYDQNLKIGVNSGNKINNYAGSSTTGYGIYTLYQNDQQIANNKVVSATGTTTTLYGIYIGTATGANVDLYGNTVTTINSSTYYGYYLSSGAGTANTINVYDNSLLNSSNTSSGSTVYLMYMGPSPWKLNYYNNSITNFTSSTTTTVYGHYFPGDPTILKAYNNVFNNNTFTGSSTTYAFYNNAFSDSSFIYNNVISNSTRVGGTFYCIRNVCSAITQLRVYGNTVQGISTSGSTIVGISNSTSAENHIYQNKIYDLTTNGSSSGVYVAGITSEGGTNNYIYNNEISDLKAPASAYDNVVQGIAVTTSSATVFTGIYYNTVYLNASSSSSTLFGSSGIYANTGSLTELRNNIVVNNSTPGATGGYTVALRFSSTNYINFSPGSNSNLYYAGSPSANRLIFFDGTNLVNTLALYKFRVMPRDSNAVSENVPFVNSTTAPYDLTISTSTATQVEGGGYPLTTPVAIATDFLTNSRSTTNPDLGAYEGSYTSTDLTAPSIVYTPIGNVLPGSGVTFSNVLITDKSGVNTTTGTRPRIYYKKIADANAFAGNTSSDNGWKWVEASNTSSPFSFNLDFSILYGGSVSAGDTLYYFFVAQDNASTANVGATVNLSASATSVALGSTHFPVGGTVNIIRILPGISGSVTVGSTGTYTSLTDVGGLFQTINNSVVSGDINVQIVSNTTEPGTYGLNEFGNDVGAKLIITPSSATLYTLSGSIANGLIRLLGADRVTIDGSYNGSGRYLKFENTSTSSSSVFWLASLGYNMGVMNDTIRNVIVSNGSLTATNYGIYIGGTSLSTSIGGLSNANIVISGNEIIKARTGLYARGMNFSDVTNLTIENNIFGSEVTTEYLNAFGIELAEVSNFTIRKNIIKNMITSTSINPKGIMLNTGTENGTITRNHIYSLGYTGTGGYGGKGIDVSTNVANSNITIANNFIANLTGDGFSSFTGDGVSGIRILGTSGGVKIYYNSIGLSGNISRSSATVDKSTGLYAAAGATNLDVRNNIFANSLVNTTGVATAFAIASDAPASAFTYLDNNNYFVSGSQGVLAYFGSNITSLADLKTATGKDANSVSCDPSFASTTNLHNIGSCMNNAGVPITGITEDFDGDVRSTTTPDIGGDEFVPPSYDIAVVNLVSPATSCSSTNSETVTAKFRNSGAVDFPANTYLPFQYRLGSNSLVMDSVMLLSTFAPGDTLTFSFATKADLSAQGKYTFWIRTLSALDITNLNDSAMFEVQNLFDNLAVSAYTMGFESTSDMTGWQVQDVNSDGKTWTVISSNPNTGTNSIYYTYNTTLPANDWLFSKCFALDSAYSYKISFYYRGNSTIYVEKLNLQVGQAQSPAAMVDTLVKLPNILSTTYSQATATYKPALPGTYYFGWYVYSAADQFNLYVDDIRIERLPNKDLAVIDIVSPKVQGCGDSNAVVGVVVKNLGSVTQTAIPVSVDVSGILSTSLSQNFSKSLALNAQDTFYFSTTINTYAGGALNLKAYSTLSGDEFVTNDTLTRTIQINSIPVNPTTTSAARCGTGTVNLLASSASGTVVNWYDAPTGGNMVGSGSPFTTPSLSATKTYYAAAIGKQASSVATIFTGTTATFKGNMFDVEPSKNIVLDSFDIHVNVTSAITVAVYYRSGSYVGYETNSSAWTLHGTFNATGAGTGNPTRLVMSSGIPMSASAKQGLFIVVTSTTGNIVYTASGTNYNFTDMNLYMGVGLNGVFGTTASPRTWNGRIYYSTQGCNSYGRTPATATINAAPSGSNAIAGTPFKVVSGAGTASNPYLVATGDTITFEQTPPTGFTNSDFGTGWVISVLKANTASNTIPVDTNVFLPTSSANGKIQYIPVASEADSVFIFSSTIVNMSSGCDTIVTRYVKAVARPAAGFTTADGCAGTTSSFTNTSSISTGSLSHAWSFGDNTTSTSNSPTHQYTTTGTFSVKLVVTSNNGVKDSITKQVSIYPKPVAGYSTADVCDGEMVNFTNSSSIGSGTLTYNWTFGDGNSSASQSPSYTYTAPGTYQVKLVATSTNGCRDSVTKAVVVSPVPVAGFTAPDVCQGINTPFTNTSSISSGTLAHSWAFGDGATSASQQPQHLYTSDGNYDVKLVVTSTKGCIDSIIKTVNVNAMPVAGFTAADACAKDSIQFTNTTSISNGNLNYTWDFGDGTVSSDMSPLYHYGAASTYQIRLIALSDLGCADTAMQVLEIYPMPVASFTGAKGCEGDSIKFTNTSVAPAGSTYLWDLSNGIMKTDENPSQTFGFSGDYPISLTVTTDKGCTDMASTMFFVHQRPMVGFTVSNTCSKDNTVFTNTTPAISDSVTYTWYFIAGPSNDTDLVYNFGAEGSYTVRLNAMSQLGCATELTQQVMIDPSPVAAFTVADACMGSGSVFTNTSSISSGSMTHEWTLGDGNTSNQMSPVHFYSSTGVFDVMLTAISDKGCRDSISTTATVLALPVATFTYVKGPEGKVTFTATDNSLVSYSWNFGNGNTGNGSTAQATYAADGSYTVMLNVTGQNGCSTSSSQQIMMNHVGIADPVAAVNQLKVFPNPYRHATRIAYTVDQPADVRLEVFDMNGRSVSLLANERQTNGDYLYTFSSQEAGATAGIFFVRLTVDDKVSIQKIVELK